MGEIAEPFWTDGAQSVRLPEGWRREGEAVQVRREGNTVILEPVTPEPKPGSWDWLQARIRLLDDDVPAALDEEVSEQVRPAADLPE
ncbi:AbrB/MazE/SpoVT family DNA-binding domain-containing protein [Methylobacterium currus]|uniref:AbrB/MazE/SpoVT family DNA-binding domain-containing protein n=1 Tax=Methylobacterium currus TaxID=2051553 RepID=A0A2R4WQT3_9HYPH|nr:AbrB/MazE/SpoVT family DNA-binding domain-containing protein [Methylobacterium currus]AWB23906.1 AbrB/MazE/SpoVT family DNA-binding domain-containing protein [Methylobacterium currus]UHC16437.1 AbrB/MazE/SpoVT family DNA-binding domain-containing protein [Methylobacterium currus]